MKKWNFSDQKSDQKSIQTCGQSSGKFAERINRTLCRIVCVAFALSAFASVSAFAAEGDKSINIEVSPLGLIIGDLSVTVDFRLGDSSWTIGPRASYWNLKFGDVTFKAYGYGVRADYYLGRPALTDGWYLGPFFDYGSFKITKTNVSGSPGEGSRAGTTFGLMVGYHWFWENFNLKLGLGYGFSSITDFSIHYDDGTSDSYGSHNPGGVVPEFTFGWAF